jgi:hypothetical protein
MLNRIPSYARLRQYLHVMGNATVCMINQTREITGKLLLIRLIFIGLLLWLAFSIFYGHMMGVYLSVILSFVFAVPTIDQISITSKDANFERLYIYSFVRLSWRVNDASNVRYTLYQGKESGDLPGSDHAAADFIAFLLPFRYKSQGIVVSKGSTKWTRLSANFGLYDKEFISISELTKQLPHCP